MVEIAWRPNFQGRSISIGDGDTGNFLGENSRQRYLDTLETVIRDESSVSVVLRGSHADDRIALVTKALKSVDESLEPLHAIGTVYGQKLKFGALAFLLTDVAENEEVGPTCLMRAITKSVKHDGVRPVVVVQYPQLLDPPSRILLAQMSYCRSILLVILAAQSEILPAEFVPVAGGPGCIEISVLPLTLDEVHNTILKEFSAVPTPVVTAELRHRSQGNIGTMLALAHAAIANGKLTDFNGYLVMHQGTWPYGGRVEALALAQISMLSSSERKFLQRLAAAGTMSISCLTQNELGDVDHLIGSGFIGRTGSNREEITHSSKVLAEVFRSENHVDIPSNGSTQSEGNFFAFISGHSTVQRGLLETGSQRSEDLYKLLDRVRESLLDGELDEAEQSIIRVVHDFLDELPPELYEAIVVAEAILQVTDDCFQRALPALEAMLAQLESSASTYDRWLIRSMCNFVQEAEDSMRHPLLPFSEHWESARWWFTELLASRETTAGDAPRRVPIGQNGHFQRELLARIVGLRNGFEPFDPSGQLSTRRESSKIAVAFELISKTGPNQLESEKLAGIEVLLDAGFVVFALPRANHILDTLSMDGKLTVASWVRRKRKGNAPRLKLNSEELLDRDYPILDVLTNREKMVATAAALGLNNQQIANDAGVSIRTVEGHLYQIYSKLALGGRRELSTLVDSLRIDSSVKV